MAVKGSGGGGGGGGGAAGIRAGSAFIEIGTDNSKLARGLKNAESMLRGFGAGGAGVAKVFGSIGNGLKAAGGSLRGLGLGVAGTAGVFGGLGLSKALDAVKDLAAIDNVAKAFGLASDRASGLFGVLGANGADNARENIESLVTLAGRVKDVMEGTGEESKKLFAGLSVSAADLAKLPIDEQFFRIHEAIVQLPDPLDRVNRLMLAFGEDGGKTLIGTLSKSTDELRRQAKGLAVTRDEMAAATAAQASLTAAGTALTGVWRKLGVALAPSIAMVADTTAKALGPAAAWIGANREAVVAVAGLTAAAFAGGVALVGLGTALSAAGAVVGTVGAGIAAVTSPLGLAAVAVGGLAAWFLTSTDRGKDLAGVLTGKLSAGFESFAATAQTTWGGITDALKVGDLALAGEIALAGLNVEFVKWTADILKVWNTFKANLAIGKNVLAEALGLPDIKKDLEGLGRSMNPAKPKVTDPGYFISPQNMRPDAAWYEAYEMIDWSRLRFAHTGSFTRKPPAGAAGPGGAGEPAKPDGPREVGDTKRDAEKAAAHFFNAMTRPFITGDEYRQRQKNIDQDFAAASKAAGDRLRQAVEVIRGGAAAGAAAIESDAERKLKAATAKLEAMTAAATAKVAAAAGLASAKAAGEKLTGPALVGLGLAGPLAQLAGAGAMNAAGLKLPEMPRLAMPDVGQLGKMTSQSTYGGWGDLSQQFGGGGSGIADVAKGVNKQVEQNKQIIAKLDGVIKAIGSIEPATFITAVFMAFAF